MKVSVVIYVIKEKKISIINSYLSSPFPVLQVFDLYFFFIYIYDTYLFFWLEFLIFQVSSYKERRDNLLKNIFLES